MEKNTQNEKSKDTAGYTTIPTALSLSLLSRVLPKAEIDRITKLYVEERNKNMSKKRGSYCPHCGKKLPIIKE